MGSKTDKLVNNTQIVLVIRRVMEDEHARAYSEGSWTIFWYIVPTMWKKNIFLDLIPCSVIGSNRSNTHGKSSILQSHQKRLVEFYFGSNNTFTLF